MIRTEKVNTYQVVSKILPPYLVKNLTENERICPECNGSGLKVNDNLYGIKGDTSELGRKYMFPYKHQSLSFCQSCYNGVQRLCPYCGKTNVLEYWGKRGISKNVIDYLDIREDLHGNGVFNFYDTNDVLTMVKYRPARTIEKHSGQPKTWCQKDSDTSALLFNMNRVNTSKPLLITEGETDCASAIEAGYINTVSVPLGAGNLHWIEENWDWLNNFDSIIIWSDNDEAGIKMRKECIYRLGTWRKKYITAPEYFEKENGKKVPIKDINDCLQIGGKNFVMNLISDAKDVPVKSVVDYSEIEELDISQMDGVKTGIKPLDEELLKIFYGTLTVLSGRPGSGKTSIIDQTIARTIDDGNPVFLFSKEMPERMSANWFNTIIAGRRNMVEKTSRDNRKYYIVPQSIQKKMQTYYNKKLFIYRDDEPNDVDSVLKSAEECVRKFGCKLIVLDNLMMIDLNCAESDKNTAQTNLINSLIKFAAKFNVAVVLIAHPRKTQDTNSDIEMYDISGTSNIIKRATKGSAGYDFVSPLTFTLKPGETIKIPTGIRCGMNTDWVLMLYPRSGLGFKYGLNLMNQTGIVDSDFYYSDNEGHIFIKLKNNGDKECTIRRFDNVVQGLFMEYGITEDDKVETSRNGGFGSTDKNKG